MGENGKPITPEARARRKPVVGTPVTFADGQDWIIGAMPVGPAGDPLADLLDEIARADTELQVLEAGQERRFRRANAIDEDEARAIYTTDQDAIRRVEREIRALQFRFQALALDLRYDLTSDDVQAIGPDLRTFRQVHQIVAGAPQIDEIKEAIEALRGGSGN